MDQRAEVELRRVMAASRMPDDGRLSARVAARTVTLAGVGQRWRPGFGTLVAGLIVTGIAVGLLLPVMGEDVVDAFAALLAEALEGEVL